MRRTSKYYNLQWIVECKMPPSAAFEPIAAFSLSSAAIGYAANCYTHRVSSKVEYRVIERIKSEPGEFTVIWPKDQRSEQMKHCGPKRTNR